jgi:CBS domain-containing protein
MKVVELMRSDVLVIGERETVADAIAALVKHQVSALPVVDAKARPVGVVSTGDILHATLARDPEGESRWVPEQTPVADIMSPWPPAVAPDSLAAEAARLMTYLNLKRVFVVDGDTLVGVLSQGDITDAVASAKL